jgi:DNA-binding NtrC family response regulator
MSADRWKSWEAEPSGGSETTVTEAVREQVLFVPRAHLEVVEGVDAGKNLELGEARVTVGRAPGNALALRDRLVSSIHLELWSTDLGYRLRDRGSTNGTFVGGTRVRDVVLGPQAQVRLGETLLRVTTLDQLVPVRLSAEDRFGGLVGASEAMRRLFALLEGVAGSELTVLLEGETGTGKEELARAVHQGSRRSAGPFVVLDCGSIPEGVAESVVFGHERGAFTGADQRRIGVFEAADRGTVFLDEIGELPASLQPKLLRVLEARQVVRLGETRPRAVDVRVVAASNRDLHRMVNDGTFRADLYYRLAEVEMRVPPLRERSGDVPLLVHHFLTRAAGRSTGEPRRISPEALARLERHEWPGNVRELRNLVERLALLSRTDEIDLALTTAELHESSGQRSLPVRPGLPYKEARAELLEQFDALYLTELHEQCAGNLSLAARRADLTRHYLRRLFRKSGISYRE